MDSFRRVKLQAMKNRKKGRFVYSLALYCLTGLACSLFCSYPLCFASLSASMKHFLFIYLPCIWSSFSNPKCFFIVANVIVVFLVGESNLFVGSSNSSPSSPSAGGEFYDEYVERSRGVSSSNSTTLQERKEETSLMEESDHRVHKVDKKVILEEEEKKVKVEVEVEEDDDEERDNIKDGEEEPGLLPAEELHKRIEDFIARVNKQRWLEARSLLRFQA